MARFALQALLGSLTLGVGTAVPVDNLLQQTRNHAAKVGLATTDNYHTLSRIQRPPGVSRTLDNLRQNQVMNDDSYPVALGDDDSGGVDHITAELNQVEYVMQVGFEADKYSMIPDTGSSDTWVVQEGFECFDPNYGQEEPPEYCAFGTLFKGDFPEGKIAIQHLDISYLSGDHLSGPMGYAEQVLTTLECITVAGVTIPKQQFALVNVAAWGGDGMTSGILGLGLPGLTDAFTGNDTSKDSASNLVNYSPLIETMGTSKAADPVLSFAMSREENRSYIAFGGVPPVPTGPYTTVPIQKATTNTGKTDYFYYSIKVDSMHWSSHTLNQTATHLPTMVVDSGTTINLFPGNIAAAINAAYVPRATQESSMVWSVPCDAVPPTLDIVIGGKAIRTHSSSMILPETEQAGRCLSGIGAGPTGSYILGDTFLQEIVAVFDISEKMELKFAQRID
ncbi:Uu.00g094120.m01.CDS01 [Anthostomella pinea]|uniref:Uu.00g094120.m01.CDS01 n=1 Tax=Anthostomella pinea TaxID=933095 RepID=A0AAI8VNK4_9PEZI|nr:Uu.00g094120.m01.CDS01 [Anthostomella pinea]